MIQTLFMLLLLVAAVVVAFFDARELFVAWYSETDPELTTGQRAASTVQLILCGLLVVATVSRLITRT